MKFIGGALKVLLAVALILLLIPAILTFVAYVGYFFGIILAYAASYVLVAPGINFETIPTVIAWLFVASSIIGGAGVSAKVGDE